MIALRRSRPALLAAYGLAALFFVAGASRTGHQDIGALPAQKSAAAERWRAQFAASPLRTIHVAMFGLPRPLGTLIPEPDNVELAGFDPNPQTAAVDRSRKGDLLAPRLQIEITAQLLREDAAAAGHTPDAEDELDIALRAKPFPAYDIAMSLEMHPRAPAGIAERTPTDASADDGTPADAEEARTMFGAADLYFGGAPMLPAPGTILAWAPGEAPIIVTSVTGPAIAVAPSETAAPERTEEEAEERRKARAAAAPARPAPREGTRVKTPAQELGLDAKARARAEKCLANAVYFEARSEPVRGQVAVAQVVLNRAFSDYYPGDVCGVVYQNARRYLSCQFTFACDGIPDVVTEPEPWERAKKIATAILDGKIWLKDVGKATHYHASYVNPYWVRSMRRLQKIGLHSFYRPRKWGDGSDEFAWGSSGNTEIAGRF